MRGLIPGHDERNHCQLHPWHASFSFIAGLMLAGLVVLALVESAK